LTHLHLDLETRSTVDIKKAGADVYARHPSTDVWCAGFAFDDEPAGLFGRGLPANENVTRVRVHIERGGTVVSHNSAFELAIWNHVMVPRYGWPVLKPEQCICTMAMAYAMSLPGSLDGAAAAVGLDQQKDMKAWRVMLQLSQPRKMMAAECPHCNSEGRIGNRICPRCDGNVDIAVPVWYTPESHPEKFETLYAYCKQDVEVERQLFKRLLPLSQDEQEMWLIDQRINQRGVQVDIKAVKAAKAIVMAEKARLDAEMRLVTGNAVATCNAAGQLTDWLRYRGVEVASIAKNDVVDLLALPTLPDDCRKALKLRQEAAKSSTAKLDAMLLGVCDDGRMRGLFQYHGAGTGRWAGRRAQPQNYPRSSMPQSEIDEIFAMLEAA